MPASPSAPPRDHSASGSPPSAPPDSGQPSTQHASGLGFCSLQAPLARVVEWHELDLERELGSGSFGEVSLCRLGGGEKVAVKRLLTNKI